MRFNMHADDLDDIALYLSTRALQGLHEGWTWSGELTPLTWQGRTWGVRTLSRDSAGKPFQSIYVRHSETGKGHFSRYRKSLMIPIVTAPSCDIEDYLKSREIAYKVAGRLTESREYKLISEFYDGKQAQRSGVPYMNHIDEGLGILYEIGASDKAMRAYCLHPLFQSDEDLTQSAGRLSELKLDPESLMLAMEYRNIANGYLSTRTVHSLKDIALSPLREVNDMLRADKVQNYKDFLRYHKGTHPRSRELDQYFHNWLARLDLSLERFGELREILAHVEQQRWRPSEEA